MGGAVRVLIWNMERDRDPEVAVNQLKWLMRKYETPVALLCETHTYRKELLALRAEAYGVHCPNKKPGQNETAIVTAPDASLEPQQSKQLTTKGWFTVRGGMTPPKWLHRALVNGRLFAVIHMPPSVRWVKGLPVGPPLRVAAQLAAAARVKVFLLWHPGAAVGGDWNDTPDDRGIATPHGIAKGVKGRIVAPDKGTKGNRTIDYAIAPSGKPVTVVGTKADHRAVVLELKGLRRRKRGKG